MKKTAPKARKSKLKVFRTPIGFHDAYVAAASQKAALAAWGSSTDLFTQGAAEVVTDSELTREPLARPGEVVRKARGSEGEHVRALGRTEKKGRPSPRPSPARGRGGRKEGGSRIESGMTKKKGRRPSGGAVERAEGALARAEAKHRDALAGLNAEAEAIDKRRLALERRQRGERERLGAKLDEARERYRSAMEEWAG